MRKGFCLLLLLCLFVTACGDTGKVTTGRRVAQSSQEDTEAVTETETEEETEEELYMVLEWDSENYGIELQNINSGKIQTYSYKESTYFLNKYGGISSMAILESGEVVKIMTDDNGDLDLVQLSKEVWRETNVTNYSVDEERNVFTLEGTNYYLPDRIPVYIDGEVTVFSNMKAGDEIKVIGKAKNIISVTVTTGQGSLVFANPEEFIGGWLDIDGENFIKIVEDMEVHLQEGTHNITVAKDGYGDTTEIEIKRGEETEVDLNTLLGDGPKYCELTIQTVIEGTTVYLDGEVVDTDSVLSVKYGVHVLQAQADGYDTWSRRLMVNSGKAILSIDVSAVSTEEEDSEAASEATTSSATTTIESASTGTTSDSSVTDAYLDTLSGIMDTLTGTSN